MRWTRRRIWASYITTYSIIHANVVTLIKTKLLTRRQSLQRQCIYYKSKSIICYNLIRNRERDRAAGLLYKRPVCKVDWSWCLHSNVKKIISNICFATYCSFLIQYCTEKIFRFVYIPAFFLNFILNLIIIHFFGKRQTELRIIILNKKTKTCVNHVHWYNS